MELMAFIGTEQNTFTDLFLGTFLIMAYILFILPILAIITIFYFRKELVRQPIKSVMALAAAVLLVLSLALIEPSENVLALMLNFIFAPLLILGSLYWYGKLDKSGKNYKLLSILLLGNASLLILFIISNFFSR